MQTLRSPSNAMFQTRTEDYIRLSAATRGTVLEVSVALNITESEVISRAVLWFSKAVLGTAMRRKSKEDVISGWADSARWSNLPDTVAQVLIEKLDSTSLPKARMLNSSWKDLAAKHMRCLKRGIGLPVNQRAIISDSDDQALQRCWKSFPSLQTVNFKLAGNYQLARRGVCSLVAHLPNLTNLNLHAGRPGQCSEALCVESLGNLSALSALQLTHFSLADHHERRASSSGVPRESLDFQVCGALVELKLHDCGIDSNLCWSFQYSPSLEKLELVRCDLLCNPNGAEGEVDVMETFVGLGSISGLKSLTLSQLFVNHDSDVVRDRHLCHIGNLRALEELVLDGMSDVRSGGGVVTSDGVFSALQNMRDLTKLHIPDVPITCSILEAIAKNTKLVSLSISGYGPEVSSYRSTAAYSLHDLNHLEHFTLNCSDVDNKEELWFRQSIPLSSVSRVCLTRVQHQRLVMHSVMALRNMGSCLEELDFSECDGVTQGSLRVLSSYYPRLQKLSHTGWWAYSKWSEEMLEAIRGAKRLQELDVHCGVPEARVRQILPQIIKMPHS